MTENKIRLPERGHITRHRGITLLIDHAHVALVLRVRREFGIGEGVG